MRRRAADESASSAGGCKNVRTAKDHGVLASCCEEKCEDLFRRAAEDIEFSRGSRWSTGSPDNAHAMLASSRPNQSLRVLSAEEAIEARSGTWMNCRTATDHEILANSGGLVAAASQAEPGAPPTWAARSRRDDAASEASRGGSKNFNVEKAHAMLEISYNTKSRRRIA